MARGVLLGLGAVVGDLDPAQLAAAADLHLGLDHARVADRLGGGHRASSTVRRGPPVGHRHAVAGEQLLALVLEQIHGASLY